MSALNVTITRMTPEEYLEAERKAEFKSEYYDGFVFAMAGTSPMHSTIVFNLAGELRQALKGRKCFAAVADTRVRIPAGTLYTYPDIVVTCSEAQFADDQKDTLVNPAIIIEVLSQSTELRDRSSKFAQYRTIDSLREYVLVSQTSARVERYERREDGKWLLSDYAGLADVCKFESLDCEVPLADIYENVSFPEPTTVLVNRT